MQTVDPGFWLFLAALILIALIVWLIFRRRRSNALRERFGDEYDRTVAANGKRAAAEAELEERERRVADFDIRPLGPEERAAFTAEWDEVKAVFVESPVEAVHHADRLLARIMKARGYPMADFEQRHANLTVDHGEIARHYLAGHEIVERRERGAVSTEELRQAMIHFEALFDDLINEVTTGGDRPISRPAQS